MHCPRGEERHGRRTRGYIDGFKASPGHTRYIYQGDGICVEEEVFLATVRELIEGDVTEEMATIVLSNAVDFWWECLDGDGVWFCDDVDESRS